VVIQCTGFFEAGDAVRNVIHDMKLPLKMIVGVRSLRASREGKTADNCPRFAERLVASWELPYREFDPIADSPEQLAERLGELATTNSPGVILWAE
jgi:hypothetical protein